MSAVIEFPVHRVRPVAAVAASADVIIFPGVRVERLAFDIAERLPAIRKGSQSAARVTEFDFY